MKKFTHKGFTLIEILIALVILSLSLTAVIWSILQHTTALQHLQDKTYAHWVGINAINQYQAKYAQNKKKPRELGGEEIVFGKRWIWTLLVKNTSDPQVIELEVDVKNPTKKSSFVRLYGYMSEF